MMNQRTNKGVSVTLTSDALTGILLLLLKECHFLCQTCLTSLYFSLGNNSHLSQQLEEDDWYNNKESTEQLLTLLYCVRRLPIVVVVVVLDVVVRRRRVVEGGFPTVALDLASMLCGMEGRGGSGRREEGPRLELKRVVFSYFRENFRLL